MFLIMAFVLPAVQAPVRGASAPTPLSPSDGAIITATGEGGSVVAPPQALPIFSWEKVPGATSYRVQFSQDVGFTTKIEFTTPLNNFMPSNVGQFSDGGWYWRVRVDAPTASDYNNPPLSFIKDWSSDGNKPSLTAPSDDAIIEFYDIPTFSWTPVIGAASYRFQVSNSVDFTTFQINQDTLATTFQPKGLLQNGFFYWRVIPLDPASRPGTSSTIHTFITRYDQVPLLLEPANGSTPTFTPTVRWAAVRGASTYEIQISTDPTFATGFLVNASTKNTTYTLTNTLDNDKNYYWRVRSYNGTSYSAWSNPSNPWFFIKRWYIQPVLLTPTAAFQHVRFPFFSWTPVPGAGNYKIEISNNPDMSVPFLIDTTENVFYSPKVWGGYGGIRYWRVTPFDGSNKQGKPSDVGQFYSEQSKNSPDLVYPLYYYPPNTFPHPDENVVIQPYEDRSVAYPLFTWNRLFDINGTVFANAYRLRVGTSINPNGTVGNIVWTIDTENLSAAPVGGAFTPIPYTIYYWQVTPLDSLGGNEIGQFSQVWKTRFDPAKTLPNAPTQIPQLLRPAYATNYDPVVNPGYDSPEFIEITPALEWFPVSGASSYQVQISRVSNFGSLVDDATVNQPAYTPITNFGQRSLGHLNFGSYYWRVRALTGSTWSSWSEPWRFQIAAQSQWQNSRTLGNNANRLEVARDPVVGETLTDYDLSGLYTAQDVNYWYFGFDYIGTGDSSYVLYLDLDNRNDSGSNVDKRDYLLTSSPAHQPEYAIYIDKTGGTLSADQVLIAHWTGTTWDTGVTLTSVGGALSSIGNFLEIQVPYSPIGMQLTTGTYSLALASIDRTSNKVMDTVPPNHIDGSGLATLDHFTTVSEHVSLAAPLSNLSGDPTTVPTTPPFFWDSPVGSPWAGYTGEIYLDAQFTTKVGTITITSNAPYYSPTSSAYLNDLEGDNTYYWRIRPRYVNGGSGSWSQAWRFERQGFVPGNLQVSVTEATPTFSWQRVEGAATYVLQVDQDPNFTSTDINITSTQTSYTPTSSLANGIYHWRVEVKRKDGETSAWSPLQTFTLALPSPDGLNPNDPEGTTPSKSAPTYCWNTLSVTAQDSNPVLFASKYRVMVSKGDPNFSSTYETVDTIQNCWTSTKGYDDGKYYWKVAMLDGGGNQGAYSQVATFTKQYPTAMPKFPTSGSSSSETPIFSWTAADGITPHVFGAASYKVEVSLVPNFSTIYDSVTTHSTLFSPTKLYQTNKTYYWHVAIIDKDGKIGPFTDASIIMDPDIGKVKVFLPITLK
jgi:hypothetical protein